MINRPTQKLTEDITFLFSLISTAAHTGVEQDGIHDAKDNDDDGAVMNDVDDSRSGYQAEKDYVDKVLDDE